MFGLRQRRAVGVLVVVGLAAVAAAPILEHARRESPDGAFVAVVRTQPFRLLIPAMPGGGSDKPGRVTIYRHGGQSCGAAWLPMASFVHDLTWAMDTVPRRATIKLVATWDLDRCSFETAR